MINLATNLTTLFLFGVLVLTLVVSAVLISRVRQASRQQRQQLEQSLFQQQQAHQSLQETTELQAQQQQQLHQQQLQALEKESQQARELHSAEQQRLLQQVQQQQEQTSAQIQTLQTQLEAQRQQFGESQQALSRHKAELELGQKRIEQLEQQLEQTTGTSEQHQQRSQQLQVELTTLQETQQQQQQHHQEKLQLLENNRQELLKEFELLSQKIFESKTSQLQQQNQKGLNDVLTPFKQQLDGLRQRVDQVHSEDTKQRSSLQQHLQSLQQLNQQMSEEAQALTTALRGEQKTQGNWGELVLETVLNQSGLREGHEYRREQAERDDDGKLYRPDVVIHLPGGKHIIVDSKVSLTAYTEAVTCQDPDQQQQYLNRHVTSVRQHIRGLGDKGYHQLQGLNSPEFVFLFMPIEAAFMAAFQQDEALFKEAFERKIVVVTPTTLLASLRTVASIWAIEQRNKHTEELAEQASKLYDKLALVVERMESLGKQLGTAQTTYDSAMTSMYTGRGNVISQADKFRKLGVRVKKEINKKMVERANSEDEFHQSPQLSDPLSTIEKETIEKETVEKETSESETTEELISEEAGIESHSGEQEPLL